METGRACNAENCVVWNFGVIAPIAHRPRYPLRFFQHQSDQRRSRRIGTQLVEHSASKLPSRNAFAAFNEIQDAGMNTDLRSDLPLRLASRDRCPSNCQTDFVFYLCLPGTKKPRAQVFETRGAGKCLSVGCWDYETCGYELVDRLFVLHQFSPSPRGILPMACHHLTCNVTQFSSRGEIPLGLRKTAQSHPSRETE